MSSREETGFRLYEDRIWTMENFHPQMCKFLSEELIFHQWLLKNANSPHCEILDNSTYIIMNTVLIFSLQ